MALNEYDPDATDIRPIVDPEGTSEETIRGLQTIIRQRDELLNALKDLRGCISETRGKDAHNAVSNADALIARMEEGK